MNAPAFNKDVLCVQHSATARFSSAALKTEEPLRLGWHRALKRGAPDSLEITETIGLRRGWGFLPPGEENPRHPAAYYWLRCALRARDKADYNPEAESGSYEFRPV